MKKFVIEEDEIEMSDGDDLDEKKNVGENENIYEKERKKVDKKKIEYKDKDQIKENVYKEGQDNSLGDEQN